MIFNIKINLNLELFKKIYEGDLITNLYIFSNLTTFH